MTAPGSIATAVRRIARHLKDHGSPDHDALALFVLGPLLVADPRRREPQPPPVPGGPASRDGMIRCRS